jgi:Flp pilus assembly protein TadG
MIARYEGRRRGATVVESAFVLSFALIFLLGIFEYSRYLMVLHVANNAAREGARFAVVNTALGSSTAPVVAVVNSKMAGTANQLTSYNVSVFAVDPSGIWNTGSGTYNYPPTLQAKSGTNWNDAQFSNGIAVQVTGTYTPILGSLPVISNAHWLNIPIFTAPVAVNATVVMGSEGN